MLNRFEGDETNDGDLMILTDSQGSSHSLELEEWIPLGFKQIDARRNSQI
jgi:hypothetical protein